MSKLLKSKFLLGVVVVAVMFVGVVAVSNTAAADCSITSTLRVGSVGTEVSCLQSIVGATADGKFGLMTKASVMAWQAGRGLVSDGVFGPKSNAVLVAGGAVSGNFPAGCSSASGYSLTTGLACTAIPASTGPCTGGALFNSVTGAACTAGLPAGCSSTAGFSPTTGASCSGAVVVSSTGEGSVTVTYDATPADSSVVNKGETKNVMGIKVKATGSDMKVSRLWLDVNTRIWLSASSMSLMDGSTVLATVALSADTVLETTAGSAWQVQFNGFNVTVPVGTTKVLTVSVTRPVLTQASASATVADTSSIRATDGAGFSNTYALAAAPDRTINLAGTSTATTGTLTATLAGTSPLAQSVSGLSTTAGTLTAVKMLDVDLKATDGPINVSLISGTSTKAGGTTTVSEAVASFELRDGTNVLSSVTGAATFSFASLNVDIPAGTTKTLSIWAKVNHVASSFVVAGDNLLSTVTLVTATTNGFANDASTGAITVAGNKQYFYRYAHSIVLGGTTATTTNTSGSISADYSIAFTVTAPAGSAIYVHKTVDLATATNNNATVITAGKGGTLADSTPMSATATSGTDGATYFLVLAGQSRTFTVYSHLPVGGAAGYNGVKLTQVYWALDDAGTGAQAQTWGLPNFNTASVYVTAT